MFDKDRIGTYSIVEQWESPQRKWLKESVEYRQELTKYRNAITEMKRVLVDAASPVTLYKDDGKEETVWLVSVEAVLKIMNKCLEGTCYYDSEVLLRDLQEIQKETRSDSKDIP